MAKRFGIWCIAGGLVWAGLALPCRAADQAKANKDAAEEGDKSADAEATPTESREETVLRNKIEKAMAKGKGDIYVLGVSETTFHTDVERKQIRVHNQKGQLLQEAVTEFKTGGEYFPVPTVQFQSIEGKDAAVVFVMDHMKKFPPVPKKKSRKKEVNAGPPAPVGDWTFVGRFSDPMKADAALKQAEERFHAQSNWKVSQKKE